MISFLRGCGTGDLFNGEKEGNFSHVSGAKWFLEGNDLLHNFEKKAKMKRIIFFPGGKRGANFFMSDTEESNLKKYGLS